MDNSKKPLTCLSLFSGYDGIGIGLEKALSFTKIKAIAHVEIEAYAGANLVNKMETGRMVPAPIWTDVKTFNACRFRNKVDILTGGYPCQPFSAAGKRKGKEDPRHLWPYVRDTIQAIQPTVCFFENVRGHISLGLREVLTDLVKLGYRVENDCGEPTWGIFSAAEVGAPHQRERVFILAYRNDQREPQSCGGFKEFWRRIINYSEELAHSSNKGLQGGKRGTTHEEIQTPHGSASECCSIWPSRPGENQYDWEEPRVVGNTPKQGFQIGSPWQVGERKGEKPEPKRPTRGCKCQTQCQLGGTINGFGGGVDPIKNREDRLRLCGNGVVPQTAEKAFTVLMDRILNPDKSRVQPVQMEMF